ncbi:MAG: helix-turn-helix domain-containing protein [Bacillota bacterium]
MKYDRLARSDVFRGSKASNTVSYMGGIVKKKRLEMNLTQESFSNGICSVSYLSKVENNQLPPNDYFVKEMSKKCNLNLALCSKEFEDSTILKRAFKAFYQKNTHVLKSLIKESSEMELIQTRELIQFAYYVGEKMFKKSRRIMKELEVMKHHFNRYMRLVYETISMIHAFDTQRYTVALTHLETLQESSHKDHYINGLRELYAYLIKQKLHKKTTSMGHFALAVKSLTEYYQPDYLMMLKLYNVFFMIDESKKAAKEALLAIPTVMIPKSLENMHRYLRIRLLNQRDTVETVLAKLNSEEKDCWYYRTLSLMAKQDPLFLKDHFENIDEDALLEKVYYESLITECEISYQNYLKDIAFPLSIEKQEIVYIDHFASELMALAQKRSRYKEALAIHTKRSKALLKLCGA